MRGELDDVIQSSAEPDFRREIRDGAKNQEILYQVLSSITCRIYAVDRQGRIIFANRLGFSGIGIPEEKLLGSHWSELGFPRDTTDPMLACVEEVFESGREVKTDMSFFWLNSFVEQEMTFSPVFEEGKVESVVITAVDVTEKKAAKRLSDALNDINLKISSSRDLNDLLRSAAIGAKKAIGAENCYLILRENDQWSLRQVQGVHSSLQGLAIKDSIVRSLFSDFFDQGVISIKDATSASKTGVTFRRHGVGAALSSPLRVKDKIYGVVAFDFDQAMDFKEHHYDFLSKLSTSLAFAVLNADLQSQEEKEKTLLETIIENSQAGVALLRGDTLEVKWMNTKALSFAGDQYLSIDPRGLPLQRCIPGADELGLTALATMVADNGTPFTEPEYEYEHQLRGKTYWKFSLIPLDLGDERDVLVILNDITEEVTTRKRIEELAKKTEEEKERLRLILNAMPTSSLVLDSNGNIIEINDMFRHSLQSAGIQVPTRFEELKLFKPRSSNTGLPIRKEDWALSRALRRGETIINEMMDVELPNGEMRSLGLSVKPLKDANQSIYGCVVLVQDLGSQRRIEQDAIQAKEKSELYLSVMGHDIDNLSTVAYGYLDMLLERVKLSDFEANLLAKSQQSLDSIHEIVQTIRNIRKADSESLKWGTVDLDCVIRESIDKFSDVPGRDVQISYEVKPRMMTVASELIQEVFDNLIGNAIKHTTGPLSINIAIATILESGREYHKVVIEDNGPGIPDEMKSKIFCRLQKGKKSGGTLGLYLVKKLVEDFQGRVWVEDRVQGDETKGARFVVLLPVAQNKLL